MGTHAGLLKSFYQHFFLPDPCCSPSNENKPGDVREIVQDQPNRQSSWWFGSCQVGIISEDFPWPDTALERQESKRCSPVGTSSYLLAGAVVFQQLCFRRKGSVLDTVQEDD